MEQSTTHSPRQFRREHSGLQQRLTGSTDLHHLALSEMQGQGFPFQSLKVNTGAQWQRDKKQPSFWYKADEGISNGYPWLQVSAGDYRETGGENKATYVYKSWDQGQSEIPDHERVQIEQELAQRKIQDEATRQAEQAAGRIIALTRWNNAKAVPEQYEHPALNRREIKAFNLRLDADKKTLLSGAFNIDGLLCGIEEMYSTQDPVKGWKATMKGTSLKNAFHIIGAESEILYICEGYSTGATIHQATGKQVYCAYSAFNLVNVAQAIKSKHPQKEIIICGDDDQFNKTNAGSINANKAAQQIKAKAVFPRFKDLSSQPTDFNDLMRLEGLQAVKSQLEAIDSHRLKAIDIRDLMAMELPHRENIIEPWFPSQGLVMLYAKTGVGKTHIALEIAYQLSIGGSVFNWNIPKAMNTLYIDGEMPANAMQQRIASIATASQQEPIKKFTVLNQDLIEGIMPDIGTIEGQKELEHLTNETDLIIVDNISTLCRTGAENKADDWMLIQQWALRLRSQGKSVLFVHHAGKGGDQRGTSKRSDVLDTVMELKHPSDYEHSQGARFEIHFQKARGCMGDDIKPIEVQLDHDPEKGTYWTVKSLEESLFQKVVSLCDDGLRQHEIAQELDIAKSTVSKYVKKAKAQGLINSDGGRK
ncbi:MAG: AAA family ATPase [Gammaproteobacteria bacterium]|jgi:putative DNA primase/helicase|nr:AAA family ATPase [Gammaproteobacteria bacterium]MBT7209415.1 AAA family ATPase [Gammaproteobacteria bacterium]